MYEDHDDWTTPGWFRGQFKSHQIDEQDYHPRRESILDLEQTLQSDPDERCMQEFLEQHRNLVLSFMRTGHGNWSIPQQSLGGRFRTDFLWATGSSAYLSWQYVELESPRAQAFLQDGQFSRQLRTAVQQIRDWRQYVADNISSIQRPKIQGGEGLFNLRPKAPALIIIGRRKESYPRRYQNERMRTREDDGIEIISYDTFYERIKSRWTDYFVKVRGHDPL